jgi:hypothetical protein
MTPRRIMKSEILLRESRFFPELHQKLTCFAGKRTFTPPVLIRSRRFPDPQVFSGPPFRNIWAKEGTFTLSV